MKEWLIAFAIDNIIPIILTAVLGIMGVKLKHVKDVLQTFANAMADGKVSKAEWKKIRAQVKTLIGR